MNGTERACLPIMPAAFSKIVLAASGATCFYGAAKVIQSYLSSFEI
jgi:hypothetical protein